MTKYTIIQTWHEYRSVAQVVEKEKVKAICESAVKHEILKKRYRISKGTDTPNIYCCIEVINNETGEIREYWNNKENKINF